MRTLPIIIFLTTLIVNSGVALAQSESRDREIAARYAPVFYQAIGDDPRSDYITNFDFDGDWRGDNNWAHVANRRFPLKAFIYYSVSETQTHYFIYYAVFHARDYKGGTTKGKILSELIREGTNRIKGFDPTGMASEATVAHENDMEGCLVVVEKDRSPSQSRIVYVETLAHNKFLKYAASSAGDEGLSFDGQHPLLYIEPKGHGIQHYVSDETTEDRDSNKKEKGNNKDEAREHKDSAKKEADHRLITYKFTGRAEQPDKIKSQTCGYELISIRTTLWKRSQGENSETYGFRFEYPEFKLQVTSNGGREKEYTAKIGTRGVAFLGNTGGQNIARPPWGWFDNGEKNQPLGSWYFDPAGTIKKHFKPGEGFSTVYIHHPILGIE